MSILWDSKVVYDSTNASYWTSQAWNPDAELVAMTPSLIKGSIFEVRWSRTVPAGVREDLAMFSFHLAVDAGPGAPMTLLDASDAARVEAAFTTSWYTPMQTSIANDWGIKEYAWRNFGADFPLDKNGFSKPGPAWRIATGPGAGLGASARLPDQVALTATFRTASRRHWGRFYSGGYTVSAMNDSELGHATDVIVDTLATSTRAFLVDLNNDTRVTNAWVWSSKYRGALSINEISVDDTWDVIRRRRAKFPSYRKTFTS